jgi:uncharacterized protein
MKRRSLLASGVAGAALAAPQLAEQAVAAGVEIPKRVFGKTGEKLTVIGQAGGRLGMCTREEAKAVVQRALDLGINYFDCAHSYWGGKSEEVFGEVLQPARKKVFLTTKSNKRSRAAAMGELELSLKRLKTDYVDLWQIHEVGDMESVEQIFAPGGAIEAFVEAKKKGLCRFMGFTGHRDPQVHLAMIKNFADYDTILMPLHPAEPAYLSFEKTVLPVAVKNGYGIQGMKSTANSKLLHRYSIKECIQYVLSLPVHCLAMGCTTIGQVEDDVRIAQSLQAYSEPQLVSLRERAVKGNLLGPGLEDWKKDITKSAAMQTPYIGG